MLIKKEKDKTRTWRTADFAVAVDHRLEIKESEKKDNYLDLTKAPRKLQNMKLTVIPIVVGALETVFKGLEGRKNPVKEFPYTVLRKIRRMKITKLTIWY